MKKRIISLVVALCTICTFLSSVYADNSAVTLNSTEEITTTELFMQYPTYLSNTTMDEGFRSGQEACYAVLDSYTETDTAVSVAMTALSKGISVKVRDELASLALTDSTYETYAKDAAKELLEQALGDEHTIGKSAKKVSKAYKHFKTAYKDINTLGQAELLEELRTIALENDISITTEDMDKVVKELFESKDLKKGLDNLDAAMDMWKYVTEMTELFAIEASTIDFLMDELDKSGQSEGDLYLGLSLLKRDIHQNPATYVLKRYVTEKTISFLSKNMEKLIYGVTGASTITVAVVQAFAKLFADYVYVDAKADKLTQAIMHMSYISSIETCLSQYRLKFLQGTGTADDIDTYESLYGACNAAYVSALDACYKCAKLDDKFSLGGECKIWADEIENYFTYDKYLEWCKAAVAHDLQTETIDSKTGESTITDALNEETILKNLERVYRLYPPNEGEIWNGKYDGVRGSVGFAAKVFNHIFDSNLYTKVDSKYKYVLTNESNVRLIGRLEEGNVTADALKTLFADARIGDVIFTSGKDDYCHAMILVGFTDNGITVYDCESKFYDKDSHPYALKKYEFTYAAMAESFNSHGDYKDVAGISVYRAVKKVNAENSGKSIADEEYDDSADFVIIGNTLREYVGTKTEVHIPYGVTKIESECFKNNKTIEKVYMPDTVNSMDTKVFEGCQNLNFVKLSNTIGYINSYTFNNCNSLSYISLPDEVKYIGEYAFYDCSNLVKVDLPNGIKRISSAAFANCVKLKELALPEDLELLGEFAFDNCQSIEEIVIPKNVTKIEDYTFRDCYNLINAIIGSNVNYIGMYAFQKCSSLTDIIIPDNVTEISIGTFSYCTNLQNVTLSKGMNSIAYSLFLNCTSLKKIYIPDSITSITQSAFKNCALLTNITIPDSVKYISSNAFENSGITSITLTNNELSIDPWAFKSCIKLENVNILGNSANIGHHMFEDCVNLKTVTMKNKEIGAEMFKGCSNLKHIDIADSIISIGASAFENSGLTDITIPSSVQKIDYCILRGCNDLTTAVISNNEISPGMFSDCSNLRSITISGNITSIGDEAFENCSSLLAITIPNSVTSIGSGAFANCINLTDVVIPSSVTNIAERTFSTCSSLKNITLSNNISSIEPSLFALCKSLITIKIPNGITTIGQAAFTVCHNLRSVYIPADVKNINSYAFYECNSLTDVYYAGTKEQWDKVVINDKNEPLKNATIHYLAESLPEPDPASKTQYSITLSDSDIELTQDDTHTLTATVTPENSVTWISSDYGVASVDQEGVITPVRAGTATITAKVDSSDAKATCTVTVLPPPEITEFYIDEGDNGYAAYITTTDVPANAAVWVVAYNTENQLIGIQKMEGNKEEQAEFDTPNAATFKVFVWNMTTLKPLTYSKEQPITTGI